MGRLSVAKREETRYDYPMRFTLRDLTERLARGLSHLAGRVSTSLIESVREEQRCCEAARHAEKDIFDELPDPPHLEYGEVRYRDGRFKYLDG